MTQHNADIPVQRYQANDGSRHLSLSETDDDVMVRQICASHIIPKGHSIDVKTLFSIIKHVLQSVPCSTDIAATRLSSEESSNLLDMTSASSIYNITNKIATSSNRSVGLITKDVCKILSSYTWYEKVVVSWATFIVNYGEFWLVACLFPSNKLAKSIAKLNYTSEVADDSDFLCQRIEAITNLIQTTLDISKCILEFKELPSQYISPDTPLLSNALSDLIPKAAYWAIKSVVACALQVEGLIKINNEFVEYSYDASDVLTQQMTKVKQVFEEINTQLNRCYEYINKKKQDDTYSRLKQLTESTPLDNTKVLRPFLSSNDNVQPLFDGSSKKRARLESFARKYIILLVTDINIPEDAAELSMLEKWHSNWKMSGKRESYNNLEVVWLPVMGQFQTWNDEMQKKYEKQRNAMPWYSVMNPSLIDPTVIRYIKEVWGFNKKTILVSMDPRGRIVHQNAFHMFMIWGILAFPFTYPREKALWQDESWRIPLVIGDLDQNIMDWETEGRLICLYGGENMEWIRKFTSAASDVSHVIHNRIELVYVGKSNPGKRVLNIFDNIKAAKHNYSFKDRSSISYFWARLESMYCSKMELGKTFATDVIMKEVMTMLSLNNSEDGWALFGNGSSNIVMAKGDLILASLSEIENWKEHVDIKGFVPALADHLHPQNTVEHCVHLLLSQTVQQIPDNVVCAECGETMEKFTMFRCCKH